MIVLHNLPSSKIPFNCRVIVAKHVNKCTWVHVEVIIKVTVPPELRRREGERKRKRGEKRERERERERERDRERETDRD